MAWKVTYLVNGWTIDFLPVTLVPTSYHQGDLLDVGSFPGEGKIGRKCCHQIVGHDGFSGYLAWQRKIGLLPSNGMPHSRGSKILNIYAHRYTDINKRHPLLIQARDIANI